MAEVVAHEQARITGAVIAALGDWQLAEDALQDACERAMSSWSRDGVPTNPAGWLVTTARRRGIDLLRRAGTREASVRRYAQALEREKPAGEHEVEPEDETEDAVGDERLRLVFTCAHPALALEARVALTLRTVLGWSPAQIARCFLITEAAAQKRLVRARARIAHAGIPYRLPSAQELPERVEGVLAVVYLLFSTGYAEPGRAQLMSEAIRLGRLVRELLEPTAPERCEASGLLALMLAQHSRQRARFTPDGAAVLLELQDRRLWDRGAVAEAERLLEQLLQHAAHRRQPVGPYTLQAAIALEHVRPHEASGTDWVRIAQLHALLNRIADTPAQRAAWAIAAARAHSPQQGLQILAGVRHGEENHLLHAARADLLRSAGRAAAAAAEYGRAASSAPSQAERAVLSEKQHALLDQCTRTGLTDPN